MPVATAAHSQGNGVDGFECSAVHHTHFEHEVVVHDRGIEGELELANVRHLGQSGKFRLSCRALKLKVHTAVAGIACVLVHGRESTRATAT